MPLLWLWGHTGEKPALVRAEPLERSICTKSEQPSVISNFSSTGSQGAREVGASSRALVTPVPVSPAVCALHPPCLRCVVQHHCQLAESRGLFQNLPSSWAHPSQAPGAVWACVPAAPRTPWTLTPTPPP